MLNAHVIQINALLHTETHSFCYSHPQSRTANKQLQLKDFRSRNMSYNQSSLNTTCGTNETIISNGTITNVSCNSNAKTTRERSMLQLSLEARITLICIYSLIFLLGMSGNSLVCYIIGKMAVRHHKPGQ